MVNKKSEITVRILEIIKQIPAGKVATYRQVAMMAGSPGYARQVAWVLHSLSEKENLPWQRVVNSKGRISLRPGEGFEKQKQILEQEGVVFYNHQQIDLGRFLWDPGI